MGLFNKLFGNKDKVGKLNEMDSRQDFFNSIHNYYSNCSEGKVPLELVKELSEEVADYYYNQYCRFRKQYPKSVKRYSKFMLKDLDHPTTLEMIIKYFKRTEGDNYRNYCMILLKMNEEELIKFEKDREDFYNMF